ncbi:type II CRISPR RNA-guided endonuclease Cas9 [Chryseobacterium sp. RRHN12]|uniref:type II CRISPR RNA-guided endonuclease Cas9 n=1 Tax=Chryseobacterium sp. RRHN12 TaxID=3437884 RepID=UPI003D9B0CE6
MSKIFGIDLGSNSCGWAIRNTDLEGNQIEDFGVITFEKGVASEKGNEFPKVQKRTESRGKRRNYQAEKYRKFGILQFLIERNMCPLSIEDFNNWKTYRKGKKREYPQSEEFLNWIRFDFDGDGLPDFHLFGKDKSESYYVFRALAGNPQYKNVFVNNPQILGRVFYQLVQRRGFKGRDEEEAKTMLTGSDKNGTKGRNDIEEYLDKYKTLGAALYHFQKDFGGRIRQRYNLRKDSEAELKWICDLHNISKDNYSKLWKAIIWQRPLRTQKGLIGNCIYEKGKKRVSVSHPLYEEYRAWVFINNLNIIPPLDEDRQEYIQAKIYPLFYKSKPDFELIDIDKQLKKDGAKRTSRHHEKTKVFSVKLLKQFQDVFGENWKDILKWDITGERSSQPVKKSSTEYTFEDVWHVLMTFDGQENLKNFALEKLNLDEEKASKFSKIKLQQGFATLSLSAIKKILPYLQKGFLYSHAVYMANLYKMLGENEISETLINHFSEEIYRILNQDLANRKNAAIVNSLISEMLNDGTRYYITDDRNLDNTERKLVLTSTIDNYGQESWDKLDEETKVNIIDYVSTKYLEFLKKSPFDKKNLFVQPERIDEKIFNFLKDTYNVSEDMKKYLWHPSEQENYAEAENYLEYSLGKKKYYVKEKNRGIFLTRNPDAEFEGREIKLLGNPEPLSKGFKNPMALKSLHKLRNLVNYLLQTGKIDEETRVVIEIARELNDKNKRKAIEIWQKEREKENDVYRKELVVYREQFPNVNLIDEDTLVRKIRLWHEQNKICLYTGKPISFSDLIIGNKYDFEHTIPASISFDNELKNLTIADSVYNRLQKGKKFPTQLVNYDTEQVINGESYNPILRNIEFLFGERKVEYKELKGKTEKIVTWKKIEELEKLFDEWKKKASYASTKEYKDFCIVKYHTMKMDLDYLKSKLATFTITEYKAGWRNNQLRDTQIITKYSLPYFKTLFKRVSVEKGGVTNIFKKIYKVQSRDSKKDRSVHSHHAQDAAILTLIPNAFHRERIIKAYQNEIDNRTGKTYHELPMDWNNFSENYILGLKDEVLINNLTDNRTITQTSKTIRKKGKIVYDIDKSGNRKKRVARGDTIRGQLHGETFYGAIKQPVRDGDNKILFDENKKMILNDEIYLVVRKQLVYKKDVNSPGFKNLEEIEKVIVDKDLLKIIKRQVEESDFKTALTEGIFMFDKKGNKVNKIRTIRCFENGLKYATAIKVHNHSFVSGKEYKKSTLATNGENTYCLFYKNDSGKAMRILSIIDVAELKLKSIQNLFNEPEFSSFKSGKGKNKIQLPLHSILKSGDKVLFYKENIHELKDLEKTELSSRMFKMYQFEKDGRIKFKHHLAAGIDTELRKFYSEENSFIVDKQQVFLRLTQGQWNFAVEGKDFEMYIDGTINWNF